MIPRPVYAPSAAVRLIVDGNARRLASAADPRVGDVAVLDGHFYRVAARVGLLLTVTACAEGNADPAKCVVAGVAVEWWGDLCRRPRVLIMRTGSAS